MLFSRMLGGSASMSSVASSRAKAAAFAAAIGCHFRSASVALAPSARSLIPRTTATGVALRCPAWAIPAPSISTARASLKVCLIHSASWETREFCTTSPAAMGPKCTRGRGRSAGVNRSQEPVLARCAAVWLISCGDSHARGRALSPSSSLVPPW
ncbi:hypothetical protein H4W79_003716 [Nocardiopsis terrae]|uniref:Uncharacterized protein n=1 Tax=Nocardiopsis terrae TaxID=372655 RepID=A0ABR9HKF0_9ACTN|nr:hypothetical protein [Nocardiopsis terrae]